ncbi:MAG: hypothetical protein KatS3mg022_2699 [Armatimonadota bacterium]|nr:MAG: hypothetical protein KatS3mg022_2699 [Armatimonadota bacterium]
MKNSAENFLKSLDNDTLKWYNNARKSEREHPERSTYQSGGQIWERQ